MEQQKKTFYLRQSFFKLFYCDYYELFFEFEFLQTGFDYQFNLLLFV